MFGPALRVMNEFQDTVPLTKSAVIKKFDI
jgi:hypothetical protein